MRVAVTGASGYLGQAICNRLIIEDVECIPMGRSNLGKTSQNYLNFELGNIDFEFKDQNLDALIHAAWDMSGNYELLNVNGSIRLIDSAVKAGIKKIIFISSMSSYDGCRSNYGKSKHIVEQYVIKNGGVVIRPGLIWDWEKPSGIFRSLLKATLQFPLLPVPKSKGNGIYLTYLYDLVDAIFRITVELNESNIYILAHKRKLDLKSIVAIIAHQYHTKACAVSFDGVLLYWGIRVLEGAGIKLPFKSDSLLGLLFSDPSPKLNVSFKFKEFKIERP